MSNTSNLLTMPWPQLARVLGAADPEESADALLLGAQPGEVLQAVKARCDQHWTSSVIQHFHGREFLVFCYSLGLALALAATVGLLWRPPTPVWVGSVLILILSLCLAAVVLTVLSVLIPALKLERPANIARTLAPLSAHRELCAETLSALEASADARAYRDRVVALERELVVADAGVIAALAVQEQAVRDEVESNESCKRVHGLA